MGQSISSIQFARLGVSPLKYLFNTAIDASSSISQFWFEVDEHDGHGVKKVDNGGHEYQIEQDQILYSPLRSSCVTNDTIQIVTAVRTTFWETPHQLITYCRLNRPQRLPEFMLRHTTMELVLGPTLLSAKRLLNWFVMQASPQQQGTISIRESSQPTVWISPWTWLQSPRGSKSLIILNWHLSVISFDIWTIYAAFIYTQAMHYWLIVISVSLEPHALQ